MTRPVRIVAVVSVPPPIAGQSMATELLLEALDRSVHSVEVVDIGSAISGHRGLRNVLARTLSLCGVWISVARCGLRRNRLPTVLYLQLGQSALSVARDTPVLAMAKLFGWEAVAHVHGGAWRTTFDQLPRPLSLLYSQLVIGVRNFVVLTESLAEMTTDVIPKDAVCVVGNGVSPAVERAAQQPAQFSKKPTVLFLSNMLPTKGAHLVIGAARRDFEAGLDRQYILAGQPHHGEPPQELPPNCVFVGPVSGNGKFDLFRRATVFVLPTSYPVEGEPISILEAMHFGLPVISCPIGGIPDVVTAETGRLIEPTVDALLEAIDELTGQRAHWNEMAANSRAQAKRRHSAERHQATLLDILVPSIEER